MGLLNQDNRYRMKQGLLTIRERYWIEDQHGQRAFSVTGKLLRVRETLIFANAEGQELYKIQEKLMNVRKTMAIESASGHTAATVHKALISPLGSKWHIDIAGGHNWVAQGDLLAHEYIIQRGLDVVAEVSKRWFRLTDTYGVDVKPGEDAALALAVTVVIDALATKD
ncbi:MAG: LURP-one-related family protein [Caldilineaceae bacterium]|nr:LURP-one-related family protein [Caldilineaceae bacterium]